MIKLNNKKTETIDEDGGIYETSAMIGFRETYYDKDSNQNKKKGNKANYKEDLSIVVIENWLSLWTNY